MMIDVFSPPHFSNNQLNLNPIMIADFYKIAGDTSSIERVCSYSGSRENVRVFAGTTAEFYNSALETDFAMRTT